MRMYEADESSPMIDQYPPDVLDPLHSLRSATKWGTGCCCSMWIMNALREHNLIDTYSYVGRRWEMRDDGKGFYSKSKRK